MEDKKITTYQMAVTALMAAVLCVIGPLSVPIGAIPISLSNFVISLTVWLLGPKFGTLSVAIYLALGAVGMPVFSGYGGGLAKLAGPSGIGLVLGVAVSYVFGTAWFVFQMGCELSYALAVCVYPFIAFDLAKVIVACVIGALLRKRLTQAGVLKLA